MLLGTDGARQTKGHTHASKYRALIVQRNPGKKSLESVSEKRELCGLQPPPPPPSLPPAPLFVLNKLVPLNSLQNIEIIDCIIKQSTTADPPVPASSPLPILHCYFDCSNWWWCLVLLIFGCLTSWQHPAFPLGCFPGPVIPVADLGPNPAFP